MVRAVEDHDLEAERRLRRGFGKQWDRMDRDERATWAGNHHFPMAFGFLTTSQGKSLGCLLYTSPSPRDS
eukprot:6621560-Prorocentrum_lima.AAC.1